MYTIMINGLALSLLCVLANPLRNNAECVLSVTFNDLVTSTGSAVVSINPPTHLAVESNSLENPLHLQLGNPDIILPVAIADAKSQLFIESYYNGAYQGLSKLVTCLNCALCSNNPGEYATASCSRVSKHRGIDINFIGGTFPPSIALNQYLDIDESLTSFWGASPGTYVSSVTIDSYLIFGWRSSANAGSEFSVDYEIIYENGDVRTPESDESEEGGMVGGLNGDLFYTSKILTGNYSAGTTLSITSQPFNLKLDTSLNVVSGSRDGSSTTARSGYYALPFWEGLWF